MSIHSFPMDGPFRERRGRNKRDRIDQGGREERRARWERGEHPEQHEGPHEHRGRGRGRHGGFGLPPLPPMPPGPFGGPEFWEGPGFGPRGHRRGRGRAGRGDVRAAILALLAEEPRNGYQIIQEIEQRTDGVWRASSGSVYPALAQLEDEGLVRTDERDGRRTYVLTDAGRAYVDERRDGLVAPWEEMNESVGDDVASLFKELRHVAMAAAQIAHVGTAEQVAQARAALANARRTLYSLLAEDARED
jgi:DNA-binding PadR family transcriptional regulator